jgi:hypothetical protein
MYKIPLRKNIAMKKPEKFRFLLNKCIPDERAPSTICLYKHKLNCPALYNGIVKKI